MALERAPMCVGVCVCVCVCVLGFRPEPPPQKVVESKRGVGEQYNVHAREK